MKNINETQIKKCILKTVEEFENDLKKLPKKLGVWIEFGQMEFYPIDAKSEEDWRFDFRELLSEYYGVTVICVHIDWWENGDIWINYEDRKSA